VVAALAGVRAADGLDVGKDHPPAQAGVLLLHVADSAARLHPGGLAVRRAIAGSGALTLA
jgi:hypothetical protein